jgi:hypothetical protein
MVAFIVSLVINLHGCAEIPSDSPMRPLIQDRQSCANGDRLTEGMTPSLTISGQEFSMRDWKLLMPNWKPKTAAFAFAKPQTEKNSLRDAG